MIVLGSPTMIAGAIDRARRHSPFLSMLLDREREVADALLAGQINLAPTSDVDLPVSRQLRIARRRLALNVAIGDLAGTLDLTAVTRALTCFADRALDAAIRAAIEERTPGADPAGFVALALGKQGSGELNYSSDIDPILLYDPATLPCRPREEPADAAVRIARRVVELLQARDADGYVLRVDLRLRPSPEITPIALPADAAIAYYEAQALPWERAAFIRARAAAGDIALGERFLASIRPFVWRRSIDYGALAEIRGISRRIRDHHASRAAPGPGYDLKRGRGGIREIEFFAQIQQLIHGGRDAALRAPATRDALATLADAGWIAPDDTALLAETYTLLRTVEHRVQMVDDRQTHTLPEGTALDGVARLHGLDDAAALIDLLAPPVARTARLYDALDGDAPPALPHDAEALTLALGAMGFADADAARVRVDRWRAARYPALRSAAAQAALEEALPPLLGALARSPDPRAALLRVDRMFERLPSTITLFRLIAAQPALAGVIGRVLGLAPTLADTLAARPVLLDGLIDASALDPLPSVADLVAEMEGGERDADYQQRLDHVRRIVGERRFALGVQVVAGRADPLMVAQGYARLAEAAVQTLAAATVADFIRIHGHVPDSELVILALGRLGGGAMTHASDLDLIFLFTGDFTRESDGAKPLGATLYYNRLAQRVIAALSVTTAAGPLYPIDTRLRPSGVQGPLAVTVDSFAHYQREDAWTWEHMALARARPIFGSRAAHAALGGIIADVLGCERPARDVAADAGAMRREMAAHKPPVGPLDVKLQPGGLVDLEFVVHVTQLTARRGFDPGLGAAIAALVAENLLPASLIAAHDLLTRMLVLVRLVSEDGAVTSEPARRLIADALGYSDWPAVLASLDRAREEVAAAWTAILQGT